MLRTGRENLTKVGSARMCYKDLADKLQVERSPRTSATPRMMKAIFGSLLREVTPKLLVRIRVALDIGCETGLGMRVTEVLSGGDMHGMKANHLRIITKLSTRLVTCEVMIEHSKTGFKRFCAFLGSPLGDSQLNLEQIIRGCWVAYGFTIVTDYEGDYMIERFDFSVVRVSMLGMPESQLGTLRAWMGQQSGEIGTNASNLSKGARDRYHANGSMEKCYVSVVGVAVSLLLLVVISRTHAPTHAPVHAPTHAPTCAPTHAPTHAPNAHV